MEKLQDFALDQITSPVAFGTDAEEVSNRTGTYYDKDKKCLHATSFLVRRDCTSELTCWGPGPIGRFDAKDILGLVKFYKSRK